MKFKLSLFTLTAGLLLMGCASLKTPSTIMESPPGLTKCQPIVKDGAYQDFGQTLLKLVDTIGAYNTCAANHNALVDYELKKDTIK